MKPAPRKEAYALHRKLSALVAQGIGGEAESARHRLARLETRFDFSIPEQPDGVDLFEGITITFQPGDFRKLFAFADDESDVAAFVKWAFSERFKCDGLIRNNGDGQSVWIECGDDSIAKMSHLAAVIRRAFADLWQEFKSRPGVDAGCRRPFLLGIYDGMMDDPRAPGQLLPPVRATTTPAKKGKKKAVAVAPGLSVHPYTLAVELGRKIRMSTPIGEVIEALNDRTR